MTTNRRFNAGEILAARFPFTLFERRPAKTDEPRPGGTSLHSVIPAPRSASPLDAVAPLLGRENHVLCDDCLGPAVVEARVPKDPQAHDVCETCVQAPYYDGAWIRPLVHWA